MLAHMTGCTALFMGVPLAGLLAGLQWSSVSTGFQAAGLALPAAGLLWFGLVKLTKIGRHKPDEREIEVAQVANAFSLLVKEKKLHKRVDPAALHLMEAGAENWARIKQALASPFWSSEKLAGHWTTIREQTEQAADRAMEDLMVLGATCIGEEPQGRKEDIEDAVEDFFDLSFFDAIDNIKRAASSDWMSYAYHSPNAKAIYEPGRLIAVRLQELAQEVEDMQDEIIEEQSQDQPASAESIDVVLSELRAFKQAEVELVHEEQEHLST
jgi:hypothetical protein